MHGQQFAHVVYGSIAFIDLDIYAWPGIIEEQSFGPAIGRKEGIGTYHNQE